MPDNDWTAEELTRLIELEEDSETPNERIILWAEVLLCSKYPAAYEAFCDAEPE